MSLSNKIATYLFIALMSIISISPVYADESVAKLNFHVSDPDHNKNTYFICGDFGCYSILASEEGHKAFPVTSGEVGPLFTTNVFTRRMYAQKTPASCDITLQRGQTLNVYGRLSVAHSQVEISGLHCKVT